MRCGHRPASRPGGPGKSRGPRLRRGGPAGPELSTAALNVMGSGRSRPGGSGYGCEPAAWRLSRAITPARTSRDPCVEPARPRKPPVRRRGNRPPPLPGRQAPAICGGHDDHHFPPRRCGSRAGCAALGGLVMPPEPACEMARAGERLDLGDRVGAWRIVHGVLDRAAPELPAGLAADLGLGEEDLDTAAVRGALRWVPPARVGGAGSRRRASPGWRARAARGRSTTSGSTPGLADLASQRQRVVDDPPGLQVFAGLGLTHDHRPRAGRSIPTNCRPSYSFTRGLHHEWTTQPEHRSGPRGAGGPAPSSHQGVAGSDPVVSTRRIRAVSGSTGHRPSCGDRVCLRSSFGSLRFT